MENKINLVTLALSTSAAARRIASRTNMLLAAPILPTLLWLAVATTIIGCSVEIIPTQGSMEGRTDSDDPLSAAYGTGERDSLRVKTDTARGRHWVLGLDRVRVYDTATKKLIRQIALPGWSVVQADCGPDLALDRSGSAFVSSNVQPRIWRIDAGSFELKEHEIMLQGKEQWDIGFGALAFTAGGTLYAMTSSAGSLWKIDVARDSASMIERYHSALNACALTPQFLTRLERSRKPWTSPSPQQN